MDKLTYTEVNGMLEPDLVMPEVARTRYGRMKLRYMWEEKASLVIKMGAEETLEEYIRQTEERAEAMKEQLVTQLKEQHHVNEELKQRDWLKYNQMLNMVDAQAEEIVLNEVIYN